MQYVEDFPSLLHSTAGSGILSNGGDSAQNGGAVLSLQSAAAHNHHRTLSCWEDLQTYIRVKHLRKHMTKRSHVHFSALSSLHDVCVLYLTEGVCPTSQLLQYWSIFSQVVICVTQVDTVTHHGNMQLIMEPAESRGQREASLYINNQMTNWQQGKQMTKGAGSAKDATHITFIT